MKKFLLIGPLPDPVTGESLANKTIINNIIKYSKDYTADSINMSYHKLEDLGKLSFKKIIFFISIYRNIFKIFYSDIVYMTCGQTFFGILKYAPFICLAKLARKIIIVHIHGNYLHRQYSDAAVWKKKIMYFILSKADKGIVLSDSLQANLSPFLNKNKIYVLYNFVESCLFNNSDACKYDVTQLRILYLSNLIPSKGIFDLLEASCILKQQKKIFSLEIAGKLDKKNTLKFEEYKKRLGDNIKYLGIVSGNKKREAFLRSNVFVFPTYYHIEGQPICILEAMATGNIILTTKHAGIPDIFTEGENGYYIDKKDPYSIANELLELSEKLSEHEHVAKNNQKIAAEKYTVEKFINNFIDIIEA